MNQDKQEYLRNLKNLIKKSSFLLLGLTFIPSVLASSLSFRDPDGNRHDFLPLSQAFSGKAIDVSITDVSNYYEAIEVETALQEVGKKMQYYRGFDRNKPSTMPDIVSSNTSRLVELKVKSGSSNFQFYAGGKLFTKTTTQSITVPDNNDSWYIYFDTSGNLQYVSTSTVTSDMFIYNAPVVLKRWNKVQALGGAGDERHGCGLPGITHKYLHNNYGAVWNSGFNIEGLAVNGKTFTQITSGIFYDEDIDHNNSSCSSVPTLYQIEKGNWYAATSTNELGYKVTGDTYYSYNPYNSVSGLFELKEGTRDTDFYIVFFAQMPNINGSGCVRFLSQNAYPNKAAVRNAVLTEIDKLKLDGLPSPELRFTHACMIKRNGKLVAFDDGSLYYDLRKINTGGSGGLSRPSSYAQDILTDTTNFNNLLSSSDTDVQKALETLDEIPKRYSLLLSL